MFKALPTVFAVLLTGTLIVPTLQAMEIEKFDYMSVEDQGDYVALLLGGAQKLLLDADNHKDLAKLNKLFGEVREGDQSSIGIMEFEANLANVRVLDAERYAKDHNTSRLEVEHAMLLTLKRNGIILPKSYMTVGKDFKPKHPRKDEKK